MFVIIGGIIVVSSYMPQITKLLITKSSKDISIFFIMFVKVGTIFLTGYSIYVQDKILIISNAMANSMAGCVLGLSVVYRIYFKRNDNLKKRNTL